MRRLQKQQDSVTKRLAWMLSANFLGYGVSFLAPLILVRILNQTQYGVYKELFQIVTTLVTLLNLQVGSSAYYFIPRVEDDQEKKQILFNILFFYALLGAAVSLLLSANPEWVLWISQDKDLLPYVPLLALAFWLWFLTSNWEWIPYALGDTRSSALYLVVNQIGKAFLLIAAALIFGTVRAVVIGAILQGVLQLTLLFLYLYRRFKTFSQPLNFRLLKEQLRNSIPYGVGAMTLVLQTDLHIYFVSHYFSSAMFAIYTVGCFQFPLFTLVESSFNQVLIPAVSDLESRGDRRGLLAVWFGSVRKMALIVLPVIALLFVVRYDLITMLYTNNYRASVQVFGVFIFCSALITLLTDPVLRAFPEMRFFNLKLSVLMLPLSWAALYLGVHSAQLLGTILAVLLLRILASSIVLSALFSKLKIKLSDIREFGFLLARPAIAAVIAGVICALSAILFVELYVMLRLIIAGCIFTAVYLPAAFLLGAVGIEEKQELMRIPRKLFPKKSEISLKTTPEKS
jgi:O-antigen/teichoic acid export membrane protein